MLGDRQCWRTVSYFFSDVFDLTFNVVGDTEEASERIVRGSLQDKAFSVLYLADNRLRGAFLLDQSFIEAKAAGSAGTVARLGATPGPSLDYGTGR